MTLDSIKTLIRTERQNPPFREAFAQFHQHCRDTITRTLTDATVEEFLVQHIATSSIFSNFFPPEFAEQNATSREIQKVLQALSPPDETPVGLKKTPTDASQNQDVLNTLYERFFQDFSVKDADRYGIVYTPQPIVDFMVNSVQHLLKTHFGKSLADTGVHIIDPFVGTGNFIVRLMQDIPGIAMDKKYRGELHCNEVMLLPYYIASMNIEHAYYEKMGRYEPFKHICFVDTFDTFEFMDAPNQTGHFAFMASEKTQRVKEQRDTPMFVVIGNPPYNAGQKNENDNNKNRPHQAMDNRIRDTYVAASTAQLRNKLYDPYVKSLRWASDNIGTEGIIAVITNNSFIEGKMFDGMRQCLAEEFDIIQILDLGGNIRKGQPGDANVFGITIGVSINFFIKTGQPRERKACILYTDKAAALSKARTFQFLADREHVGNVTWHEIQPNARQMWLTEGHRDEFDMFIPMGTKAAKAAKGEAQGALFKIYSMGTATSRDAWVYSFSEEALAENMTRLMENYNSEVARWGWRSERNVAVKDFVDTDKTKIKWSRSLFSHLRQGSLFAFSPEKVITSLYRPFNKLFFYNDSMLHERTYLNHIIFSTPKAYQKNRIIGVSGVSHRFFQALMMNVLPSAHVAQVGQLFPFYTYDEDGTNRRENITDWALVQFREHYGDETITKWDIFHYTYAVLHHPAYRETYQVNLKHDLPHIPFAPEFWQFVDIGRQLADLHVNYEDFDVMPKVVETPPLNWRVEKMALSKDKTQLRYNESLTVTDIPPEVFDYRVGTRSALEWVINRYCVREDPGGSGIVANPNRAADAQYIVRLIGQVMHVSVETVRLVGELPSCCS